MVSDYLKSVDLKLNGQALALNLSCWFEVGWGNSQWGILTRGFELGSTTSFQPHTTKLISSGAPIATFTVRLIRMIVFEHLHTVCC
jgi:hypothetical protein